MGVYDMVASTCGPLSKSTRVPCSVCWSCGMTCHLVLVVGNASLLHVHLPVHTGYRLGLCVADITHIAETNSSVLINHSL